MSFLLICVQNLIVDIRGKDLGRIDHLIRSVTRSYQKADVFYLHYYLTHLHVR